MLQKEDLLYLRGYLELSPTISSLYWVLSLSSVLFLYIMTTFMFLSHLLQRWFFSVTPILPVDPVLEGELSTNSYAICYQNNVQWSRSHMHISHTLLSTSQLRLTRFRYSPCAGKIHLSPPPPLIMSQNCMMAGVQRYRDDGDQLRDRGVKGYRGNRDRLSNGDYIFRKPWGG